MTRAHPLLREALQLPHEDRADLVAEFLASLVDEPSEDSTEVAQAWGAEIERRARRAFA